MRYEALVCFFIFSHSTFDVGRSMFIFLVSSAQKQLNAYGINDCATFPNG
jgi:hypothetical protein